MKYIMFRLATCPAYNEGTLTMYLMYQDSFLGSHDASPRITLPPPSPNSIVLAEATRRPAAMQARTFLPSREPFTFTDEFNRRGSSTLPRSLPPPSSICLKPTIATLKSRVGFSILTPTPTPRRSMAFSRLCEQMPLRFRATGCDALLLPSTMFILCVFQHFSGNYHHPDRLFPVVERATDGEEIGARRGEMQGIDRMARTLDTRGRDCSDT